MRQRFLSIAVAIVVPLMSRAAAYAQEPVEPLDIEVPTIILEDVGTVPGADNTDEIDLANVVQSATRGVTTVQKAPAIVTVVTDDEIAERHFTSLEQIIDAVPGWMRLGGLHSQFPLPLARGQPQAALLLHDGLSLLDPTINVSAANRVQPVEMIKRVELVTGPGGVLWGSNALLGIINVITKDASDVEGVEANVTLGGGNGDRDVFRAYVLAGDSELFGGKLSGLFHASFESYLGPGFEMPIHLMSAALPQPNSIDFYGPLTRGEPSRSYVFVLNGKIGFGKWQLRGQLPFVERHSPLSFDGGVVRRNLPEDTAIDPRTGLPACPNEPPYDIPDDLCSDKARLTREHEPSFSDRYAVAEYRTRNGGGNSGFSLKGYLIDFVRRIDPFYGGAALPLLLEGGISFQSPMEAMRAGSNFDGDIDIGRTIRVLYGAEAYHEWQIETETGSRQGPGVQIRFYSPLALEQLPLPCPRDLDPISGMVIYVPGCPLTMSFRASRTGLGAYVDTQWRPNSRSILDAGARVQVAPAALGEQSFALTPTFAGALVYELSPRWHAKLNVTQGFRPPIFNNIVSNGEAIQIDGDEGLKVETSTAGQAELNARIFNGEGAIRELGFRADYSYTYLQNLIQIVAGRYENTADRGIHSFELLGKLYMQGGHRIELGYTWLRVETEDVGLHRSIPQHWFNLGTVFQFAESLSGTSTLRVIGAMEDSNRMVEYRDYAFNEIGQVVRGDNMEPSFVVVSPSELVFDRLPPVADVSLGLTWTPFSGLNLSATVQNAFNARYYQPDAFFSYEPRVEFLPNPAEDLRAYASATYRY